MITFPRDTGRAAPGHMPAPLRGISFWYGIFPWHITDRILGNSTMDVSIVIPCYNSEKNIGGVIESLDKIFSSLNVTFEYVLVNDCSKDRTFEVISDLARKKGNITAVDLAKNSGQHAALMAGFHFVKGDVVVTCEDDGQTNIDVFPELYKKVGEGYDVATVRFKDRGQRSFFRRMGSKVAETMEHTLIYHSNTETVSIIFMAKRFVIEELIKYDQPFPFLNGLVSRTTANIARVESVQKNRSTGHSGYNFKKLISLWLNGFTAFSIRPLRVSVVLGAISSCIGLIMAVVLIIRKLIFLNDIGAGWTSIIAVILIMSGIILAVLGMIGEYIGRIYLCINQTPQFVVRRIVGNSEGKTEEPGAASEPEKKAQK